MLPLLVDYPQLARCVRCIVFRSPFQHIFCRNFFHRLLPGEIDHRGVAVCVDGSLQVDRYVTVDLYRGRIKRAGPFRTDGVLADRRHHVRIRGTRNAGGIDELERRRCLGGRGGDFTDLDIAGGVKEALQQRAIAHSERCGTDGVRVDRRRSLKTRRCRRVAFAARSDCDILRAGYQFK